MDVLASPVVVLVVVALMWWCFLPNECVLGSGAPCTAGYVFAPVQRICKVDQRWSLWSVNMSLHGRLRAGCWDCSLLKAWLGLNIANQSFC